jgi:hypothetical protein
VAASIGFYGCGIRTMPGKRYPRPWCRLDREYLAQDTVRELGQQFGAAGPLVFLAIVLEAGKTASGGWVEMRYQALAQLAFVDAEIARDVVTATGTLGLLDGLHGDAERFRGLLTRFDAWEAKDPTAAERQARARERESRD